MWHNHITMNLTTKNSLLAHAFLFLFIFSASWAGTFAWQNRSLINELFYQANEQRYRIMAGEAGPVTYLVHHKNFQALEAAVQSHDDILGIEVWQHPGIAAVAFDSIDSASIQQIEELAVVSRMVKRNVPMICH